MIYSGDQVTGAITITVPLEVSGFEETVQTVFLAWDIVRFSGRSNKTATHAPFDHADRANLQLFRNA